MAISSIVYNVGAPGPKIMQWATPPDDVSLALGNKDGVTFCGSRKVTIKDSPKNISWWSYNPATLAFTVDTTGKNAQAGTYNFSVEIEL